MSELDKSSPSQEEIRLRSYLIWEREGRPCGREVDHWLRAEAELADEAVKAAAFAAPAAQARARKTAGKTGTRAKSRAGA